MSTPATIGDNLAGAWAVMRGRAEGLARMDLSLEGFWRSFGAVLLLLPFLGVTLISEAKMATELGGEPGPLSGDRFTLQLIPLSIDWLAFPLLFALLARPLGQAARYVPFIVTRNWAAVILVAATSVIHMTHIVGLVPSAVAPSLVFAAVAITLRFSYVIARTTLMVPLRIALPIVILDFVVSLTIWSAFQRLAQSG